eukprot:TCONS_00008330-protein
MFIIGSAFIIVMMFTRKRHNLWVGCCFGYPGPVIPLNMLDSYENRKGFAISFGLVATLCLNVLLSNYDRIYGIEFGFMIMNWPAWTQIFVKILSAFFISIVAYPFFVCQNMKNRLVGSILGIILTFIWICLEGYRAFQFMTTCFKIWAFVGYGEVVGTLLSLVDYPTYISLLLLFVKFVWTFIKTLKQRKHRRALGESVHWMFANDEDWKSEYMYLHVKNLLKKVPKQNHSIPEHLEKKKAQIDEEKGFRNQIVKAQERFRNSLYQYKPEFKYSTRMMSSVLVTYIGMYQVTIFFAMYGYVVFLLFDLLFDLDFIQKGAREIGLEISIIEKYISAIGLSWWLGLITALVFSILVMSNSISWYRKHMLMLRKGDYSFLPRPLRKKKFNSASFMVASMKFAGFQVAYACWGFLVLAFLLFFAYWILITQIIFAIRDGRLTMLLQLMLSIWPTIVIAIGVFLIQYVMATKLFLFDKMTLQVDNRRVYHIISYSMFYFNIFLGLVSCLLRIIFGMLFGIIFLQRLQKSTLPRAAELIDPGYSAYLGYILLEHQHANPVIQCFTRLLMESVRKEINNEQSSDPQNYFGTTKRGLMPAGFLDTTDMSDIKREIRRKKRILIRWHLYITLSLNPTLLKFRFRNAVKRRKFNLDFFNRLNPSLYWPEEEAKKEDEKEAGDQSVVVVEDENQMSGNFYVGDQKVDVRYRRTGTVLEVIYSLKDAQQQKKRSFHHAVPEDLDHTSEKVLQYYGDNTNDVDYSGDNTEENGNNIELVNYRRLSSRLHREEIKESKVDDLGDNGSENDGDNIVVSETKILIDDDVIETFDVGDKKQEQIINNENSIKTEEWKNPSQKIEDAKNVKHGITNETFSAKE